MDNNLNDQITENSEGEEKSPSSYTDPNAGYTEAEPQAKNDNSVPKEAADDNLKQEEKSACHSGTSDGTYENNTYNGNSYYNGTNQSGAYTNGYSDNQYQNSGYNTGFNASGYNNNYNSQNNCQMPPKQMDLSPLSTGEWLLTMIVGIIPCAGLILYIIWAFGNSGNLNRRNYCRASLILQVISYVLVIFFVIIAAIGRVSYYGY